MFFVLNMFYLAVLLYVLALCTSLFFSKTGRYFCFAGQNRFSIYLFCMGLTANFFSIAGRYYFAFPLMPMYQTPFFLPFFIGILSIKIIWQEDKRALGMVFAVCFLSVTAVLFPNDFYLPFLKSRTIFSHIFFLSGVAAKACLLIAGVHSFYDIFIIKRNYDIHTIIHNIRINKTVVKNWITAGFSLWTISIFSGEIWSFLGWGSPVVWDDPAILTTMATWLYYVCYLHLHYLKTFNYKKRAYAAAAGTILMLILNFYPELGIFQIPQIPQISQIFKSSWIVL